MLTQALKLSDRAMLDAARGRLDSLVWRTGLGAIYAVAAGFAFNSVFIPLWWYGALCAAMLADHALGKRYVAATSEAQRRFWGLWFVLATAVTQVIFVSMTVGVGLSAGFTGRIISLTMAAGSIATATLYQGGARAFMAITLAPTGLWLVLAPAMPISGAEAQGLAATVAMYCATIGFFAYALRSLHNNGKLLANLASAEGMAQQRLAIAQKRQSEAEEADRAKSEFLTTMTHELRTPLNAVIGYSEIIGEDMAAEGHHDLAKDASRITAAARHLLGLIDQILQLTQIDAGRSAVELDQVDVRALIEGTVAGIDAAAKANNNRVSMRIAPNVGIADTDGEKLGLCIAHLLSNAVKFTSNGLIAISAERENLSGRDWLRISVSDTGIGMSEDEIVKAFQPFMQLDGTKTRAKGGMGLGLSITARVARVLGGEVTAVSEAGAGSTFTLRLPVRFELSDADAAMDARAA